MLMKIVPSFLLALCGGTLLGIGFIIPLVWPLCLISCVFLIAAFSRTTTPIRSYALGFFASGVSFGLSLYPMLWAVQLPENLVSHRLSLIALTWGVSVLAASVPTAFFALYIRSFSTRSWKDLIILPSGFTLFFSLSSWAIDAANLGMPIRFGGHSTLGLPAYLLANDPALLQTSWALGVYGLLFTIAFVGTLIYRMLFGTKREQRALIILSVTLFLVWGSARVYVAKIQNADTKNGSVYAIALSAELPVKKAADSHNAFLRFEILDELVQNAEQAAILVLPEDASYIDYAQNEGAGSLQELKKFELVIDSTYADENGKPVNRIRYFDPINATSEYSYKWFLAPFGEYLPFWMKIALKTPLLSKIANYYFERPVITEGQSSIFSIKNDIRIGALLCIEAVTPHLYREHAKNGATIFANLSSLRSYKGSRISALVMERIYKVRAAENRRYMIVSSDSAPAYIINPFGVVISKSSSYGLARAQVSLRNDITPYTRLGSLALIPFIALSTWGIYLRIREKRSPLQNIQN